MVVKLMMETMFVFLVGAVAGWILGVKVPSTLNQVRKGLAKGLASVLRKEDLEAALNEKTTKKVVVDCTKSTTKKE